MRTTPDHAEQPATGPVPVPPPPAVPAPAPHKRKRIPQRSVFVRTYVQAVFLIAVMATAFPAHAQVSRYDVRSTATRPVELDSTKGWVLFNDTIRQALDLDPDQVRRLQEVDGRYRDRYLAFGEKPWRQRDFRPLTQAREQDVRRIMDSTQYDLWVRTYGSERAAPQRAPRGPLR